MSQKVIKWTKKGAILIGGNSDYYCGGIFCSSLSFWSQFYCFVDSFVFFTSSKTSLHWFHRILAGYLQCKVRLMHCKVL